MPIEHANEALHNLEAEAPVSRVASRRRAARSISSALPLLTAFLLATPSHADWVCVPGAPGPNVGVVTAISGTAWAQSERCGSIERRPLACGTVLYEDDHVITRANANVAFEIEQAQVHVGPDSDLRVTAGADGAPDLLLLEGRVRVVDADAAVVPDRRLATPGLVSVGRGDTEANVPRAGASSICEYARPIVLGDGSRTLEPGTCAGPNFVASDVAVLGISLIDAGRCDYADADFDPTDVAAGPVPASFPSPLVKPPPEPVCQAGTCRSVIPPPPTPKPPTLPLDVIESPGVNKPPPL